jgi:antiviral helicase SKI2
MLYKGADLIRDVEFVIFDEVHYVNDLEVRVLSILSLCRRLHNHSMASNNVISEEWCGRRLSSCFRPM